MNTLSFSGEGNVLSFTKSGDDLIIKDTNGITVSTLTDIFKDLNTQLTTEEIQDVVGAMVTSNTETNISVNYDDTGGKLNFVSTDTTYTFTKVGDDLVINENGVTISTLSNIFRDTNRTDESIEDVVGAMVTGGTETNISVTYDDTGGKLNFVVPDTTFFYDIKFSNFQNIIP